MNDGKQLNRLDTIVKKAFDANLCSFTEALVINLSTHMVGTLEPIGHLEEARQRLVANYDGGKPDESAFYEMYDWTRIETGLTKLAITCISTVDLDHSEMAQELETIARWIRLAGEMNDEAEANERVEPHITL